MILPPHLVELSPSKNTESGLLELARQIAKRDDRDWKDILSEPEIFEVCAKSDMGRKDKLRSIRVRLEKLRFPLLKKLEAELDSSKKVIQKELGLTVELPVDLEGDTVSLRIKARSQADIAHASKKLEVLAEMTEMKRIFSILSGEI